MFPMFKWVRTQPNVTLSNAAVVIEVVVGLSAFYLAPYIAAHVWIYGRIPELISRIVHQLK